MAGRLRSEPLRTAAALAAALAGLLLATFEAASSPPTSDDVPYVVRYSFDDDRVETGPDTFTVFEHARGSVTLSSAYRVSGYHSVEIRDVAGDGDFPELQGAIPLRRSGRLYAQFALLVTDPAEALNVALAGPAGFRLGRDGIAFWLRIRDGWLEHVTDSIPKKLLRLEPFVWYRVELVYAIDRGRYDLSIAEEGRSEPVVDLQGQPNAARQAGSAVDKFSFIGDVGTDRSNAVYYVDDVVIGPETAILDMPLTAPGRRRLFFDRFLEARERSQSSPCLEGARLADFTLGARAAQILARGPVAPSLRAWLAGRPAAPPPGVEDALAELPEALQQGVMALRLWAEGCHAAAADDLDAARDQFAAARKLVPEARMPLLAEAVVLAISGRHREAEDLWARVAASWEGDPREPVAQARLGLAHGRPDDAEWWLREQALAWLDGSAATSGSGQGQRIAVEYFHVLLWLDRGREAAAFAAEAARRAEERDDSGPLAAEWIERAADAAFFDGDHAAARAGYERALASSAAPSRVHLKLSDVHHLRGDLQRERAHRERIHGTLRPTPARLDASDAR